MGSVCATEQQVVAVPTMNQAPGGHSALPYQVTPGYTCLHRVPDNGSIGNRKLKIKRIARS